MSMLDALLRWLGSVGARTADAEAPPEESRCWAYVHVGNLTIVEPRERHRYVVAGGPPADTCIRCGSPNTRRTAVPQ